MRMHELAEALDLLELTPSLSTDADITRGYASDLLSDILAHAPAGGVLITLQSSPDVIAVATLASMRAVIFCCGRTPDDHVIGRAMAEGLPLFRTESDSFEVAGRLYALGIRGRHGTRSDWHYSPGGPRGTRHPVPAWPEPLSMPPLVKGEN